MREDLRGLAQILRELGSSAFAKKIEDAISNSDEKLEAFLVSNELWGGAGSVADEGGLVNRHRTEGTRRVEHALIRLGSEQIRLGKTSSRTQMWVEVFKKWESTGV